MELTKKIPSVNFPSIHDYSIVESNEKLVSLSEAGFLVSSQYYT